ncbi:MAG: hypothetical protein QOH47_2447 [Sphingomonadales bacterium]|jgi:hypothetical protein|nr:hypothetical protein [Sphingomonadales bacterium]
MSADPLPMLPREFLIMNCRGLALAAFGSIETIQRLLGCDAWEAAAFQGDAAARFYCLLADVATDRERLQLPDE